MKILLITFFANFIFANDLILSNLEKAINEDKEISIETKYTREGSIIIQYPGLTNDIKLRFGLGFGAFEEYDIPRTKIISSSFIIKNTMSSHNKTVASVGSRLLYAHDREFDHFWLVIGGFLLPYECEYAKHIEDNSNINAYVHYYSHIDRKINALLFIGSNDHINEYGDLKLIVGDCENQYTIGQCRDIPLDESYTNPNDVGFLLLVLGLYEQSEYLRTNMIDPSNIGIVPLLYDSYDRLIKFFQEHNADMIKAIEKPDSWKEGLTLSDAFCTMKMEFDAINLSNEKQVVEAIKDYSLENTHLLGTIETLINNIEYAEPVNYFREICFESIKPENMNHLIYAMELAEIPYDKKDTDTEDS